MRPRGLVAWLLQAAAGPLGFGLGAVRRVGAGGLRTHLLPPTLVSSLRCGVVSALWKRGAGAVRRDRQRRGDRPPRALDQGSWASCAPATPWSSGSWTGWAGLGRQNRGPTPA